VIGQDLTPEADVATMKNHKNGSHPPEDNRLPLVFDKLGSAWRLAADGELGHARAILLDAVDVIEMILGL
jgi:hypothetical protein